jgi:hypothetical protein
VETKPGYKTTEFYAMWATNLALLISAIAEGLPPKYAAFAASIVTGLYSVGRAISKFGLPYNPPQ